MAVNETPLPSFVVEGAQQRDKQIYWSYQDREVKGGTIKKDGAGEVIDSGTVMGYITADKKWVPYDGAALDGSEVAQGVLETAVDTRPGDALGNIVVGGYLITDALVGLDAGAITDLGAVQNTAYGYTKF